MLETGYTNSIIRHRTALKSVLAAAAPLMTLLAVGAHAGVSFYFTTNDFVSASASLVLRGTEDWSSAGNAPAVALSDPLSPGVANGPFANGSSLAAGAQVQSNSLGDNPTNIPPIRRQVTGCTTPPPVSWVLLETCNPPTR